MIEFSSCMKLNEIHKVDSPPNKDNKIYLFFQIGLNVGGGTTGIFRENRQ